MAGVGDSDAGLEQGGGDARTSGQICLAVVQSVLLYGSDKWVMTLRIRGALGIFYHRVDSRLKGRQPWRGSDIVWIYPPLEDVMTETVL